MEEATKLWRRLFGDRFKASENPAKAVRAAGYATAPAAAVGGGYVFPDAAAAPNKPRGFA
jgi:hypothetical protein